MDKLKFRRLASYSSDVIRKRYENKSTVITTNKSFEQWSIFFNDLILTKTIKDKVDHPRMLFQIKGQIYGVKNVSKK